METNTSKNTLLSSTLKEDKINRINMIRNSRYNSSAVIINKSGGNTIPSSKKDNKIEVIFPTEKNNKHEPPSGGGPIPPKNDPAGYKIKMTGINGNRYVNKIERNGKNLFESKREMPEPLIGMGGAIGMVSDAGAERIKRIKENIKDKNNTVAPGKTIMHINPSKSPESNGRIPEGKTLSSVLHFRKRGDDNEKTEILNRKKSLVLL